MALSFEFATAGRIIFGAGKSAEVPELIRSSGTSALLITGKNPGRAAPLKSRLDELGVEVRDFSVPGEPTVQDVEQGVAAAAGIINPVVVGVGGGSVLDAAKAVAVMLRQKGRVMDFLEVVGEGKTLEPLSAPCIAVPTTAGTGSEVTRNAVLSSPAHRIKASLRSPAMLPRYAVVDPRLCLGLPAAITATTGMDALTQLMEAFVCIRSNPVVDGLCVEGMTRSARSLRRVMESPEDLSAREDLCVASLHSGFALANAGLGAVHGFAAPIGGMFNAPHGAVCAALLAPVTRLNYERLKLTQPNHPSVEKYHVMAKILTGESCATAADGIAWIRKLTRDLQIPGLRSHAIEPNHFAGIASAALKASSMKANPVPLTEPELISALEEAY